MRLWLGSTISVRPFLPMRAVRIDSSEFGARKSWVRCGRQWRKWLVQPDESADLGP
jgi:hypothetical protein